MSPETFKAAVLEKIGSKLSIENLKVPELQKGQVLVKVFYTSICASQLFEIEGRRGEDLYLPHLLGHEGFGEVMQIGEGVKRFEKGDKVILTWIKQEGLECEPISYRTDKNKLINAGRVTTFSELTVVSENRLFRAPAVTRESALPQLGCAALTGAGMVYENIRNSDRVLVVGAGGVGLFSILALIDCGVENIYVVEKNINRISQVGKIPYQIQHYQGFSDSEFLQEIERNGNFDLIFEATGDIEALQTSIKFMTKKGKLVFASHPTKGQKLAIEPYELIQGKVIIGSWGGGCEELSVLQKVTDLFVRKIGTISKFVSDPFPLLEINNAIDIAKKFGDKRVVIGMLK